MAFETVSPDYVSLIITTSGKDFNAVERRFPKSITIAELKGKMELQTGGSAATMSLEIYDKEDTLVCQPDNPEAALGSYFVKSGMRLHVVDKFLLKNFEDPTSATKFDLSKEQYDQREDSVKSFLKKNQLGKYSQEEMAAKAAEKQKKMELELECAQKCKVNDRCLVEIAGQPSRRGVIKYVGEIDEKPGWWVGVQYDEPLGKHNGTLNGKTYFECPPNYGAIVRASCVKTGDYPEVDYFDEEL